MKKLLILLILCLLNLHPQISNAQEPVKIGFCMANINGDRWLKDKEYMPVEAAKLGGEAIVYDARNNHDTQFSQVKEAIEAGITVLILIPVDAIKSGEIVDYAHSNGIKVISYDRLVLNADIDYYISFDPIKVGSVEAEYAVNLRPEGNYIVLKGPVKDYNAVLFAKGQMEVLEPYIKSGKIKIIYEKNLLEWGDMEAFMDLQEFIPSYEGKIDVILSTSDKTANGAIVLLESFGVGSDCIITGSGVSLRGCQDILNGKMAMSVYKPVKDLVKLVVEKAVKISRNEDPGLKNASSIHNGKYDVPAFYIDPLAIDRNNISKLVEDGFWKEEEIFTK